MFTRQHYEKIADIIAKHYSLFCECPSFIEELAEMFKEDSEKFDKRKFYKRILGIDDFLD